MYLWSYCLGYFFFFFLMIRRPPSSTLFPSPPLFRSDRPADLRAASHRRSPAAEERGRAGVRAADRLAQEDRGRSYRPEVEAAPGAAEPVRDAPRSEEHTSELQSQSNLVCRLLLEKKK